MAISSEDGLTFDGVRKLMAELGTEPLRQVVMHPRSAAILKYGSVIATMEPSPDGLRLMGYPVILSESAPVDRVMILDDPFIAADRANRRELARWMDEFAFWNRPIESSGQRRRRMLRLRRDASNARRQGWTMREGFSGKR